MRVLLDSCVWGGAVEVLRAAGHEVDWVGLWASEPGDEEILRQAAAAGQVLVTIDKDFGELAVVRGMAHAGSCVSWASARRPRAPLALPRWPAIART